MHTFLKSIFLIPVFLFVNTLLAQEKIVKTNEEWKKILTPKQYYILRQKGTEPAFSGELNKVYTKGIYYCAACNTPLFNSDTKFDSGTGWPSFYNHIGDNIDFVADYKYGITRVEIICKVCDGHLGHVFNDGPKKTTGKRYCVNSISLTFKESNN